MIDGEPRSAPIPGPTWHVKGTGDFNGDGKSDILWQNDNGTPAIWLMDGMHVIGAGVVGANPGPSWHVMRVIDLWEKQPEALTRQTDHCGNEQAGSRPAGRVVARYRRADQAPIDPADRRHA